MRHTVGMSKIVARFGGRPWFAAVARRLVPADRLIGRLTRGRVVALGLVPSLIITTTGRRSGLPRSNPLVYVRDGDAYVVVGSNWGRPTLPAWVYNLRHAAAAVVTVGGRKLPVRASAVSGAERDRLWRLLVAAWPAYEVYVRRAGGRELPVYRLEPSP